MSVIFPSEKSDKVDHALYQFLAVKVGVFQLSRSDAIGVNLPRVFQLIVKLLGEEQTCLLRVDVAGIEHIDSQYRRMSPVRDFGEFAVELFGVEGALAVFIIVNLVEFQPDVFHGGILIGLAVKAGESLHRVGKLRLGAGEFIDRNGHLAGAAGGREQKNRN